MIQHSFTDTVFAVISEYPEAEWDDRLHAAFPKASRDEIVAAIEMATGGDVEAIDEPAPEKNHVTGGDL